MIWTDTDGVDGFTDTQGETNVDSPDPGLEGAPDPLSPEEYAEAQREIREQGNANRSGHQRENGGGQ